MSLRVHSACMRDLIATVAIFSGLCTLILLVLYGLSGWQRRIDRHRYTALPGRPRRHIAGDSVSDFSGDLTRSGHDHCTHIVTLFLWRTTKERHPMQQKTASFRRRLEG